MSAASSLSLRREKDRTNMKWLKVKEVIEEWMLDDIVDIIFSYIRGWNWQETKQGNLFQSHASWVNCLCYLDLEGGVIASGSADRTVKLWSLNDSNEVTLKGHTGSVRGLNVLSNGHLVSAAEDSEIRVWKPSFKDQEKTKATVQTPSGITSLCILSDALLAVGHKDSTISVYSYLDDWNLKWRLKGHRQDIWDVCRLEVGSSGSSNIHMASCGEDGKVMVWDIETGKTFLTWPGHRNCVNVLLYLPSRSLLASGADDRQIMFWDERTNNKPAMILEGHTGNVRALSCLSDETFFSGAQDKTIRIWDLSTRTCLSVHKCDSNILALKAIRDESIIVSAGGSDDPCVRGWTDSS